MHAHVCVHTHAHSYMHTLTLLHSYRHPERIGMGQAWVIAGDSDGQRKRQVMQTNARL